jgi:hypothetical protein
MNVTFYVAPYEADAQLAFLSRQKIVDVVISEDSDCVPYGVKTVLFKLSPDGWGSELKRRSLGANEELSFVGWTEEMVRVCVACRLGARSLVASLTGVGAVCGAVYSAVRASWMRLQSVSERSRHYHSLQNREPAQDADRGTLAAAGNVWGASLTQRLDVGFGSTAEAEGVSAARQLRRALLLGHSHVPPPACI